MIRAATLLVFGLLAVSLPAAAREEQDEHEAEPSTGMLLGIEGGAGMSAFSATQARQAVFDTKRWNETAITTHVGALWQWQFRRFRLGFEVDGGVWRTVQGDAWTVGAGVVGGLRWPERSRFAPRLMLMVGPSWIHPPAPREFAIRHAVEWSIGLQGSVGLGIEHANAWQTIGWFCDLRATLLSSRDNEHEMVDGRTGERASERIDYFSQGGLAVFGVWWHPD